jgi:integration host factor subunit alpha
VLGTLTKMDIVSPVQTGNGSTLKESTDIDNTILKIIKSTLASSEDILISSFGKFQGKDKRERKGRNPGSGDEMTLPASRMVKFKCSGNCEMKVNGFK